MVEGVGLGCMSLSWAYGTPPADADGEALLHRALDLGYDLFDTAALYGMGHNETLIGRALKAGATSSSSRRSAASVPTAPPAPSTAAGRASPRCSTKACAASGVDHIDLYYLHRLDPKTPVEESVSALAEARTAGKIGSIGLSGSQRRDAAPRREGRADRRAPDRILAVDAQPRTRRARRVPGAGHDVRRLLAGRSRLPRRGIADVAALPDGDIRRSMPRFREPNLSQNQRLLATLRQIAADAGQTPAQVCLAWLLTRDEIL